jgi:endoglucanase
METPPQIATTDPHAEIRKENRLKTPLDLKGLQTFSKSTPLLLTTLTFIFVQPLVRAQGAGYWHTSGNQILDSNNKAVRISGINWSGFESPSEVVHGLYAQDYKYILNGIKSNGYNTIRLPFSNQMVEFPIVPTSAYIAYSNSTGPINTDLQGLDSLQILDRIVAYAGEIGLRIILDNHRSDAGETAEENGLWYTPYYPEADWIGDWEMLAERYKGNSTVIGMDLRNEPHSAGTDGACWSCGTEANDWHLAAERGGNAILKVNPKLLVFVEGTDTKENNSYWWGGNLLGVKSAPVVLDVKHQLVYSAHDYGPVLYPQSWFNAKTTPASLDALWTEMWGYVSQDKIAPVWVGEFGTPNTAASLESSVAGSQGQWFESLVAYLDKNSNISWTYWDMAEDNYALLDGNWDTQPVSSKKQQMLASLQFKLASTPSGPTQGAACHVSYSIVDDWGTGFEANLEIENTGTTNLTNWTLVWTFPDNQVITDLWNGIETQSGENVTIANESYNGTVPSGGSVQGVGFNANYGGTNSIPANFALNGVVCK